MKKIIIVLSLFFINTMNHAQNTSMFSYRFIDSSVPPQYHRSYSIIVRETHVDFTIDSYGDVLLDDKTTIEYSVYQSFVNELKKLNIKISEKGKTEDGCTGGTSEKVELMFDVNHQISGYVYHCGGEDYGNIKGDMKKVKSLFQNLVKDFDQKLMNTR